MVIREKQKHVDTYSYTSFELIKSPLLHAMAFDQDVVWILIKQGQTIQNTIKGRIQQQDNAATTSNLVLVSELRINEVDDPKLDDKIREEQHKQPDFKHYERVGDSHKRHEWSEIRIDDLINKFYSGGLKALFAKMRTLSKESDLNDFLYKTFILNSEFLDLLDEKIIKSKKIAIAKILGTEDAVSRPIILRPHQILVLNALLEANKPFNLLSMAPRFGKTITVLEVAKTMGVYIEDLILVVASKNLGSNFSFAKDYKDGYYHINGGFRLYDGSLFQHEDIMISELEKEIRPGTKILLVTDEADQASHTAISREKLALIYEKFDVVKQIVMTGTGIYKAAKIFHDVDEKDIFKHTVNYTEMVQLGSNQLVKRLFCDVQAVGEIGRYLNMGKALKNSFAHKDLAKTLARFFNDETTDGILHIKKSDVIMCFLPPVGKTKFNAFVKHFNKAYPQFRTMSVHGDYTTNRKAEAQVRRELKKMKEAGNEDDRTLIIFSMGMASRSFSVPEIRRVVILTDNCVTSSFVQQASRGLTYNMKEGGKQESAIIRVSFEPTTLAEDMFLLENEVVDYSDECKERGTVYLSNNSFEAFTINLDGGFSEIINIYAANFIDKALKFSDHTKYIVGRLTGVDLLTDVEFNKQKKTAPKTADDSYKPKEKPEKKEPKKSDERPKDEQLAREAYVNMIRTVPYILSLGEETPANIDELLSKDWALVDTSKKNFIENLKHQDFVDQMEAILRNAAKTTDAEKQERIIDYTEAANI